MGFLDFDNYFVNMAKVDLIGRSIDTLEQDHGTEPPVRLWIYMDEGDPIEMPYKFDTVEQAEQFKHGLLRRVHRTGLCLKADLDELFVITMGRTA